MDIENLDIKYAIKFLETIDYKWNGYICDKQQKPTTVFDFFCPQEIKLVNSENKEELKFITFYDESSGENKPSCEFYKKVSTCSCVSEKDLTKEWIEFLNKNDFTF